MPSNTRGPVRRAQLIAPFGPGAMVVARGGVSLITAGLDHWFQREDGQGNIEISEFRVPEWRLENLLGVAGFRMPPDYRTGGPQERNIGMTVPFLRFPQWHFCPRCHLLKEFPLVQRGSVKCPRCEAEKKTRFMFQVPFVALCDRGHIQDFPWREWVHHSLRPLCDRPMRLMATGSASLSGQKVKCECGEERTLGLITGADPGGAMTHLSSHLAEGAEYLCQGRMPWLGSGAAEPCGRPLRGSLRNASNVYYAQVRSSIYLPRGHSAIERELVAEMERPPLSTNISVAADAGLQRRQILQSIRTHQEMLLTPYNDQQILAALEIVLGTSGTTTPEGGAAVAGDSIETAFRREELAVLLRERAEKELMIRCAAPGDYGSIVQGHFSRIMLVDTLRETRVLAGFTRILPGTDQPIEKLGKMLWRNQPPANAAWLPACTVHGEGILLQFSEERLRRWEAQDAVGKRITRLANTYAGLRAKRSWRERTISPRFVLLHTTAHLLMNRLTFECGYSSAALRERLYVSENAEAPMASVLIYTADGDSEGTMGGLVRMGKPGYLEPVLARALEAAGWCSADPVCMEMGNRTGQGPDSCNLAACHNCALVPETACEEFNRFLDRAAVVGDFEGTVPGYFAVDGN